jgi:hypothetical protein
MEYRVKDLKKIGLDCKRHPDYPRVIIARTKYTKGNYYPITRKIWERASQKKGGLEKNIIDIFDGRYLLIDTF